MDTNSPSARSGGLTELTRLWWLPVLFGVVLIIYAFVVLSFTIETVWAVAVLLGVGLMMSGIGHLMMASAVRSWRWVLVVFGVIDLGLGITALIWPGATFLVLARLVGWVLLFRGVSDIVRAFESRRLGDPDWWLLAALGVIEIAVAFWAVRYDGRSIVMLVLWIGIALLSRGIAAITAGFAVRGVHRELRRG